MFPILLPSLLQHHFSSCFADSTSCAVSNAVPEDPVVDVRRGYVYERALIEKYLHDQSKCPMTGEPLAKEDLLPLKAGKPSRPRHSATMSIPGLIAALHKVRCVDVENQRCYTM
jgi:hypothetical protein